jgi:hypothetical protein
MTPCTASTLVVCWDRICPAVLGEIGGCGVLSSTMAWVSCRKGGGTSLTELSQEGTRIGGMLARVDAGEQFEGLWPLSVDIVQWWAGQLMSLQKAVWVCS